MKLSKKMTLEQFAIAVAIELKKHDIDVRNCTTRGRQSSSRRIRAKTANGFFKSYLTIGPSSPGFDTTFGPPQNNWTHSFKRFNPFGRSLPWKTESNEQNVTFQKSLKKR
ncbi:MAG: hypothetical protein K1X29_04090, partial [Bdellovibrionales bacterium]|nr:hypothetical protein [Bdellovibrionales bacterium]